MPTYISGISQMPPTTSWVSMKPYWFALLAAISVSDILHADETDLRKVFLAFEAAYKSNNADDVGRWLSPDAKLSVTFHSGSREKRTVETRDQMLKLMRQRTKPQIRASSQLEQIQITSLPEGAFCGSSKLHGASTYPALREVRKVCFRPKGDGYEVTEQSTDVYHK